MVKKHNTIFDGRTMWDFYPSLGYSIFYITRNWVQLRHFPFSSFYFSLIISYNMQNKHLLHSLTISYHHCPHYWNLNQGLHRGDLSTVLRGCQKETSVVNVKFDILKINIWNRCDFTNKHFHGIQGLNYLEWNEYSFNFLIWKIPNSKKVDRIV